jgi:NAD(P)-dependent dehydrogenase (short-subunit alcohol dehydrogenase family)
VQALAAAHPGRTHAVQAALEDEVDVQRAMAEAVAALGPVHVLIVNHGIWPPEDVLVKVPMSHTYTYACTYTHAPANTSTCTLAAAASAANKTGHTCRTCPWHSGIAH